MGESVSCRLKKGVECSHTSHLLMVVATLQKCETSSLNYSRH